MNGFVPVCDDGFGTASCPWHNEKTSDDFDWSIGRGSTSSSNNGPSKDSKGSNSGEYRLNISLYLKKNSIN